MSVLLNIKFWDPLISDLKFLISNLRNQILPFRKCELSKRTLFELLWTCLRGDEIVHFGTIRIHEIFKCLYLNLVRITIYA